VRKIETWGEGGCGRGCEWNGGKREEERTVAGKKKNEREE
jgi:hypothetical protein